MTEKTAGAARKIEPLQSYRWARTFGVPRDLSAEVAAGIFEEITRRDGVLTLPAVVAEATPAESPLHAALEWDDADAAESYRLAQAGNLVRSLVIIRRLPDRTVAPPVRAFVRVRPRVVLEDTDEEIAALDREALGRGNYIPAARAFADPQLTTRLLLQARSELSWFRRKFEHLQEFAALWEAMDAGLIPSEPTGTRRRPRQRRRA